MLIRLFSHDYVCDNSSCGTVVVCFPSFRLLKSVTRLDNVSRHFYLIIIILGLLVELSLSRLISTKVIPSFLEVTFISYQQTHNICVECASNLSRALTT